MCFLYFVFFVIFVVKFLNLLYQYCDLLDCDPFSLIFM